jgi:uncharacterized membrane protein HdeD (DUF308 family)
MDNSLAGPLRSATTWSIVLSVLMIAAGVIAIFLPMVAGVAITAVVGWLLILSGALHLVFAWRSGSAGAVVWEILLGVVYGAIGLYLLMRPIAGLASLTLALAIYLFVEAVLEFLLAFQLRPARGTGWIVLDGIVTLVLAGMIWTAWPSSAAWAIGTLVGISMLFSGITRLMLSVAVRRVVA